MILHMLVAGHRGNNWELQRTEPLLFPNLTRLIHFKKHYFVLLSDLKEGEMCRALIKYLT